MTMEGVLNTGQQWASQLDADTPLITKEMLQKAFDRFNDAPPCTHVFHPMATGWQACAAMCGALIDLGDIPISERIKQRNQDPAK